MQRWCSSARQGNGLPAHPTGTSTRDQGCAEGPGLCLPAAPLVTSVQHHQDSDHTFSYQCAFYITQQTCQGRAWLRPSLKPALSTATLQLGAFEPAMMDASAGRTLEGSGEPKSARACNRWSPCSGCWRLQPIVPVPRSQRGGGISHHLFKTVLQNCLQSTRPGCAARSESRLDLKQSTALVKSS